MNLIELTPKKFASPDDLVEVYECDDGTWRVAYYPFADKDRSLTREQAFALAEVRHLEAVQAAKVS